MPNDETNGAELIDSNGDGEKYGLSERAFWQLIRQSLLLFVDAIERRYRFTRTSELRRIAKNN